MDHIRSAIVSTLTAFHPMSDRQVFYQLETKGVVPKTEAAYKGTVVRLLGSMRRSGELPFGWITDETRLARKPPSFSSMGAALRNTAATYRRALWEGMPAYVEVWCEKLSLSGILAEETELYDVPLMLCRGFSSISFLWSAAETIMSQRKPAYLYFFGDYDPSGLSIFQRVEKDLRAFAPKAEIHLEHVAVTPEQIARWRLPTRPTKTTDSRAKGFGPRSVELDALPPDELRLLARRCIERHLDEQTLAGVLAAEAAERKTLDSLVLRLGQTRRAADVVEPLLVPPDEWPLHCPACGALLPRTWHGSAKGDAVWTECDNGHIIRRPGKAV